jgi:benzoylformate decarboxylase
MAYNYPVAVGLVADPKLALAALLAAVSKRAAPAFQQRAEAGRKQQAALKAADWEKQQARAQQNWDKRPMSPARLMMEIRAALPKDAIVTQEAITSNIDLARTLLFERPDDYFGPRGGGIGQGLPSAIGVKLAHPQRPVICLSGDGSSLYTIQALWSAAHHKVPVVFIILNNRVYRILKLNMNRYRSLFGVGGERPHPHMDLTQPDLQYVDLARGFGVEGRRIEDPAQVGPALQAAVASGKPMLLDVLIDGTV